MLWKLIFSLIFIGYVLSQAVTQEKTLEQILNDIKENDRNMGRTDEVTQNPSNSVTRPVPSNACAGICIPQDLCNANGTVNIYGADDIDVYVGPPKPKVCSASEACCQVVHVAQVPEIPSSSAVPETPSSSVVQEKPSSSVVPEKPSSSVKREGCGFRNVNGLGTVNGSAINNLYANYAELPWMVALLENVVAVNQINKTYKCGGSLIHPQVVLTAAHCVKDFIATPLSVTIRAGEWDTRTTSETFSTADHDVEEIVIHEHYNQPASLNDIALVFVTKPFDLSENIQTICLPPTNFNFDGNQCITSGWGKDKFEDDGRYQTILKKIELPIVPRNECEEKLRTTRLSSRFILHESFICAGGAEGIDTCIGDGGSPLVCPIPNTVDRYYQAGIVAWGIGCNKPIPGVYVNIPLFKNWIDQKLESKSLQKTYYTA